MCSRRCWAAPKYPAGTGIAWRQNPRRSRQIGRLHGALSQPAPVCRGGRLCGMEVMIGEREVLTQVSRSWEPFGLTVAERRQHVLLLGKTGVGKSTLLRNMIVQDIQAGRGCLFIDPHGDEAERLLDYIPPWRTADVGYIDLSNLSPRVGLNVIARKPAPLGRVLA